MGNFKFSRATLPDILIIEPKAFEDERGFFMESYHQAAFREAGLDAVFVQDNHSRSAKGVVRGLHYQLPPDQMGKMVKVVKGRIFDVGVDIRKRSPTFGKWYGEVLSEENKKMLYFPPGFAHGFLSLSDGAEVLYKCTALYAPASDRGIAWNDPNIGIKWPLDQAGKAIVSDKDGKCPRLLDAEVF